MTTLAQAQRIQHRVAQHAELMRKFIADGMGRDAASKKALDIVTGKANAEHDAARAKAQAVYESLQNLVCNLSDRWREEREYEDSSTYADLIKSKLPEGIIFDQLTLRPFGFKFKVDTFRFHIQAPATKYVLKPIA
ncbi:hypothetical protein [Hyphomicrobium sp.]|uniref:hypothetical protein n=1 Tax=Hyphomicrobium sp. TaxID=82 RepID=UPI001DF6A883|nr:hypothetical protein [Hyphomicrobium sp.]MBY0561506.1 hypothetical protein [Hyphomicrobium sp.]